MSDRYTIEYEVGDLLFEFTPATGFKGNLTAVAGEQPLTLKIDLNSRDGRSKFMKEAYDLYPEAFALEELDFRRALNDLATHVDEEFKIRAARAELEEDDEAEPDDVVAELVPEHGTDRHEAAMEILQNKDVLEEAAETMRRLGHVGEWENKKLALLCAISARAQLPVQPSTHAQSSAGKNYLWDNVLALVPPELVHKRTGFSAKALFRTQMSLKHSVLYIQELAGSEGADFSIRTLQSDNVLKWEATEKQPDGTMANVEYEVEGPTVIVQTTTRNHLHPENETRVVPIYLDESSEQTDKIVGSHLRRATGKKTLSSAEEEALREAWQDAIRLLEPAEVIIPFAERIKVPSQPLRMRRDVPRLISLIRLVAWLHQETRGRDDQDRILATEHDFEKAIEIVGDSFARAWKSLTPTEEKVYEAITTHVAENLRKHGFKRSHVETALEKTGETVPTTTLKDALRTLAGSGFLETDGKRGATGATYTVAKSANAAGTIKLAGTEAPKNNSSAPSVHSSIRPKSGESGIGTASSMDGSDFVHSRPSSVHDDDSSAGMANGRKRTEGSSSIKVGVPMPKSTDFGGNGRMDERSGEENKNGGERVDYEYSEDE